jgi:gentisate 1,2-dioxygenase
MATITTTSTKLPIAEHVPEDATKALLANLEIHHTKPLWAQMNRLNPPLPNPTAIPHVWRYDEIRPHLLHAGELITEKQAERRVAMLVNPARGESRNIILETRTNRSLSCSLHN